MIDDCDVFHIQVDNHHQVIFKVNEWFLNLGKSYEYIWIIQNKVVYNGSCSDFITSYANNEADFLAYNIDRVNSNWYWNKYCNCYSNNDYEISLLPIFRVSAKLLNLCNKSIEKQQISFYEAFYPTNAKLNNLNIDIFEKEVIGQFHWNVPVLKCKPNTLNFPVENVYLITQIYFTENEDRNNELHTVIDKNHKNTFFTKIFFLNERLLGYNESKNIEEHLHKKRIKFNDVFDFVKSKNLDGFIVFANSDIYFDHTLCNIDVKLIHKPIMYCQLRNEELPDGEIYLDKNADNYIHGWSHDAWIYHSNFNHLLIGSSIFQFGTPNCDPVFANIAKTKGFELINKPYEVRCVHLHNIDYRTDGRDALCRNQVSKKMELKNKQLWVKPT